MRAQDTTPHGRRPTRTGFNPRFRAAARPSIAEDDGVPRSQQESVCRVAILNREAKPTVLANACAALEIQHET